MSEGGPGLTNASQAELAVLQRLALEPLGTIEEGSLGYLIQAIYGHMHSAEQWFGRDPGDNLLNRQSLLPWVLGTGVAAEAYGTEVQLSDGTEVDGGNAAHEMDVHRIFVAAVSQNNNVYKVELWHGLTTFAAAALLTETLLGSGGAAGDFRPAELNSLRVPCNHRIWARAKSATAGPDTISIQIGVHTYNG